MTSWILILLTFLPFLAAIIAYMLGRRDERTMNGFVSITGIVIFALSVVLLFLPEGEVALPGFCGLGLYLRGCLRRNTSSITATRRGTASSR